MPTRNSFEFLTDHKWLRKKLGFFPFSGWCFPKSYWVYPKTSQKLILEWVKYPAIWLDAISISKTWKIWKNLLFQSKFFAKVLFLLLFLWYCVWKGSLHCLDKKKNVILFNVPFHTNNFIFHFIFKRSWPLLQTLTLKK